jgi:Icc-related predicted phosphoesterase
MTKKMAPRLQLNRLRHGRALDLLVSHAPPRNVNDRPDPAHRGFETIRGFLEKWRPGHHIHGHVHLYDRSQPFQQRFADTDVINVFPYRVLELEPGHAATHEAAAASP